MFGKAGMLALLVVLLAVPASAEWNSEVLLSSQYYLKVVGMSDDGTKIVYIADTDNNHATTWDREVFLMDLESGDVTRITRNTNQEVQAGISDDGKVVVYGTKIVVNNEVHYKYYMYSVESGSVTPMGGDFIGSEESYPVHGLLLVQRAAVSTPFGGVFGYLTLVPFHTEDKGFCGRIYWNEVYQGDGVIEEHVGRPLPDVRGRYIAMEDEENSAQSLYFRVWPDDDVRDIFTTSSGEKLFREDPLLDTLQPFSVSSDGKIVFVVYPETSSARKGIFLYDGNGAYQISEKTPDHIRISNDGSRIFFMETEYDFTGGYTNRLYVINSDGSGESLIDSGLKYNPALTYMFVNEDGKIIVLSGMGCVGSFMNVYCSYSIAFYTESRSAPITDIHRTVPTLRQNFFADKNVFIPINQTVIEFASAEALIGSEIQVPVTIENADRVGAMNLLLNYPSDVLEVEDVIAGSLTQNSLMDYNVMGSNISVGIVDSEGISGDGSLIYIKFRVASEKELASKEQKDERLGIKRSSETDLGKITPQLPTNEFDLLILDARVTNVDKEVVDVLTINGNLKLVSDEEAIKGDVNGDGQITSVDSLLALQMSVGKIEENAIADMNGDGKVGADDALNILKLSLERNVGGG